MLHQPTFRQLLLHLISITVLAIGAFLWSSQFLSVWDGHAVSIRPQQDQEPSTYSVLVSDGSKHGRVIVWPSEIAERSGVPLDRRPAGTPGPWFGPAKVPEDAPHTEKQRYRLHYLVEMPDGGHRILPTTSPQTLSTGLLTWFVLLLLRNMVVAGTPFRFAPAPIELPSPLPPNGQVARRTRPRGRKGPPPAHRRKGRGR